MEDYILYGLCVLGCLLSGAGFEVTWRKDKTLFVGFLGLWLIGVASFSVAWG